MLKRALPAALAGTIFLLSDAGAAVIASSSLASGQVTFTSSNDLTNLVGPSVDLSFSTEASASAAPGDFGSALGEVTGFFEFTNSVAGTVIEIIIGLTQSFDLDTDHVGDIASGSTSLSLAIFGPAGPFLPTLGLSDPTCDPNAAFSVVDGGSFSRTCATSATFTFPALDPGDYMFTFASDSSVDVLSAIPLPGSLSLFGLGLAGLVFGSRRATRITSA